MKTKIMTILGLILVLSSFSYAYVKPELYNGVQVKNYAQRECTFLLDQIPERYYEGLYSISFMTTGPENIDGYYFLSHVIYVYTGCDMEVLVHELAHHCQYYLRGDSFNTALNHAGSFESCKEEIWESVLD